MCVAVLFLSGCGFRQRQTGASHVDRARMQENMDQFVRLQARLVDIPIAVGAVPCLDLYDEVSSYRGVMLQYKVSSPREDVIRFYTYEMERMGWQCIMLVHASEDLLIFDKPERLCAISIRSAGLQVLVVISTGAKDMQS